MVLPRHVEFLDYEIEIGLVLSCDVSGPVEVTEEEAGDLLATGTPGGCALQAPARPLALLAQRVSPLRRQALMRRVALRNPRRLRPGDVIEAAIRTDDGRLDLGAQRNQVVLEPR